MLIRIAHHLEEGFIALLLALMTLITFSQVIARYFFGTGFGWALELTTYLFAWLVLFGVSYGIKVGAHIGIDVVVRQLPHALRRAVGLIAVLCCCAYCVILLVGAVGYVYKCRVPDDCIDNRSRRLLESRQFMEDVMTTIRRRD